MYEKIFKEVVEKGEIQIYAYTLAKTKTRILISKEKQIELAPHKILVKFKKEIDQEAKEDILKNCTHGDEKETNNNYTLNNFVKEHKAELFQLQLYNPKGVLKLGKSRFRVNNLNLNIFLTVEDLYKSYEKDLKEIDSIEKEIQNNLKRNVLKLHQRKREILELE